MGKTREAVILATLWVRHSEGWSGWRHELARLGHSSTQYLNELARFGRSSLQYLNELSRLGHSSLQHLKRIGSVGSLISSILKRTGSIGSLISPVLKLYIFIARGSRWIYSHTRLWLRDFTAPFSLWVRKHIKYLLRTEDAPIIYKHEFSRWFLFLYWTERVSETLKG